MCAPSECGESAAGSNAPRPRPDRHRRRGVSFLNTGRAARVAPPRVRSTACASGCRPVGLCAFATVFSTAAGGHSGLSWTVRKQYPGRGSGFRRGYDAALAVGDHEHSRVSNIEMERKERVLALSTPPSCCYDQREFHRVRRLPDRIRFVVVVDVVPSGVMRHVANCLWRLY